MVGDLGRVERRHATAAAVGLGRAATAPSVGAAGDDVARPLSLSISPAVHLWKRLPCMQIMFVGVMAGIPGLPCVKELAESFLKPCGSAADSKGSPLAGGRTGDVERGGIQKNLRGTEGVKDLT